MTKIKEVKTSFKVLTSFKCMEQETGLEPALSAWKADVLATDTIPAK